MCDGIIETTPFVFFRLPSRLTCPLAYNQKEKGPMSDSIEQPRPNEGSGYDLSRLLPQRSFGLKLILVCMLALLMAIPAGFVWMVTPGNDRVTQVNAGRAYARLQLAATAQGLAMQPLSQALQEYVEQQKPYAEIHALAGAKAPGETVQMWARVGYAPAVQPAPRRRLQDFIRA